MKRIIPVLFLAFALAGCSWSINPLASITNPVNTTNLYQAELAFDAQLKTFNELKGLCAKRVLPSACRTYVIKGHDIIVKEAAADAAARRFVDNNPTLDATNVVQAVTGLVSDFTATVNKLSAIRS